MYATSFSFFKSKSSFSRPSAIFNCFSKLLEITSFIYFAHTFSSKFGVYDFSKILLNQASESTIVNKNS